MKIFRFILIIILMLLIVAGIANSTAVTTYITTLKLQQTMIPFANWERIIKEYAQKNNAYPIEPRVDKVWRLIPGYNGLIVDKSATLELITKMKPKEPENVKYIWKQVTPEIELRDLGPHPIYRGNPQKPAVSLMINVAWGTEFIDSMLATLNNYNVKATFFLDGSWLKDNLETAKKIYVAGHEIGNHAYSHPQLSRLSTDRIKQEILKTEELIKDLTGESSTFFAPPAGDYDQRVVDIAHELNMYTVLWTLDTIDWQKPSSMTIIKRIIPKVDNGNLILMHPTKSSAEALPKLIEGIKNKGLIILSVGENLSPDRVTQVEPPIKF